MKLLFPVCLSICILVGACSSPRPTPLPPTPTAIPAYVAGEEDLAYAAFVKLYDEICWRTLVFEDGTATHTSIDLSQIGRAVYVGNGIWRFRIFETDKYEDMSEEVTFPAEEKVITTRSLADGSWEDPCPDAGTHYESDYNEDEREDEYSEPPVDLVEPDEDSSWDTIRP